MLHCWTGFPQPSHWWRGPPLPPLYCQQNLSQLLTETEAVRTRPSSSMVLLRLSSTVISHWNISTPTTGSVQYSVVIHLPVVPALTTNWCWLVLAQTETVRDFVGLKLHYCSCSYTVTINTRHHHHHCLQYSQCSSTICGLEHHIIPIYPIPSHTNNILRRARGGGYDWGGRWFWRFLIYIWYLPIPPSLPPSLISIFGFCVVQHVVM